MAILHTASNRVVSRTLNGIVTSYACDGWNLIEDYDASGNELARYVHGPQSDETRHEGNAALDSLKANPHSDGGSWLPGRKRCQLLSKISATGAVYYIQDGNHNVTTITDSTGSVVERYSYDVYGAATITDASGNTLTVSGVGNRFLFTGREHIAEIGIYDYRNRVYSANLGRFLQTDPIRFQAGDINIYRYVGNSPVNGRDPMGLCDDDNLGDHWPDQLNPNALVEAGNDLLAGATLLAAAGVEGAAAVVGTIGALSYGVGRLAGGH